MVLEASQLCAAQVVDVEAKKLAVVDKIIFDGNAVKVAGFAVKPVGLLPTTKTLNYDHVLACQRQTVVVDQNQTFGQDLKPFDELSDRYGSVLNVSAQTESGEKIGRVTDVLIDVETGLIVRFYLRELIRERIIPRSYLVAITPKKIVFQDVVNQPLFDEMATAPVGA